MAGILNEGELLTFIPRDKQPKSSSFAHGDWVSLGGEDGQIIECVARVAGRDIYKIAFMNGEVRRVSHRNLVEGVSLDGPVRQAAFIVAVAEAYDAAPAYDEAAKKAWDVLIRHTQLTLYKRLVGSGIEVSFEADDPYDGLGNEPADAMKYMLYDMVMNHRLRIYSGHSDNHPTFSAEQNVIFRAVHDFFTHGTVRAAFKTSLKKAAKKLNLRAWPTLDDAHDLLALVKLPSHTFTARGELSATSAHMRLAPKEASPALFTEVTGQACYFTLVGQFPEQKVAVLPGFDYSKIGVCVPGSSAAARMQDVYRALKEGEKVIPLKLKARASIPSQELLQRAKR